MKNPPHCSLFNVFLTSMVKDPENDYDVQFLVATKADQSPLVHHPSKPQRWSMPSKPISTDGAIMDDQFKDPGIV